MMVMELREEVDLAQNEKDLECVRDGNDQRIREACHEIGAAFDRNDLDDVKRWTAMLQYWNKIEEEILKKVD